ncbi:16S rRNA (cytosine967-C5)-methyltransferase [Breoghania corrubedonensis]|uniref:16S rRNA (Cytosine967-C5)-methyltransferase n=1 Tax=Breoghania corrubedonensis TaxID=665038 RepID=A0A2T5V9X1_9HYPH|nr:RsmB/NOP family class I SAM-dependent RNA methyltransferase [Breoghania corrubedonensis]PTW60521.1 16S rRNA (cytosine967-C5)-methyltransferase [Breoghania corrubedonensis]
MKDGGRLAAAIEVIEDIENRRRPVQEALKDWGTSHRFAGSGDRTVIGNLVFDVLRKRSSLAWRMGSESARDLVLGVYALEWGNDVAAVERALADDRHAPDLLSDKEKAAIAANSLEGAPDWVRADIPEWLWPSFSDNFDDEAVAEGAALSERAPIDLRVNTLKATREKVLKRLGSLGAEPTLIASTGVRLKPRPGAARMPHVQAEEGYRKGWFELQDEASQIAALLVFAQAGEQVLDFCAGGGGKTLALAAAMENRGQIYAYDSDKLRLAPIHERIARAGARNIQVRQPSEGALDDLVGRMDRVLVDAPCTGTGVWRRRPDAKWRLTEPALEDRIAEQEQALGIASAFVKPGGFLIYATCSVLAEENEEQVYRFTEANEDFEIVSVGEVWQDTFGFDKPHPWSADMKTITMTPASTGTDGFFVAVMTKNA